MSLKTQVVTPISAFDYYAYFSIQELYSRKVQDETSSCLTESENKKDIFHENLIFPFWLLNISLT